MQSNFLSLKRIFPLLLMASVAAPLTPQTFALAAAAAPKIGMDAVVGDASGWTFFPPASTTTMDGKTSLLASAPGQSITLDSKATYGAPMEYVMLVRLHPAPGASASTSLQVASRTLPDKTTQALSVGLSATHGQELVAYNTNLDHAKDVQQTGTLGLQAVAERSLAWPEEMRQTIEAQMGLAPRLATTTFTLRATVARGLFRSYLNGRFLHEFVLPPSMEATGAIKIQLHYGAQLLSIRAHPLKPVDAHYEPVPLDSYLNSSRVGGKKAAEVHTAKAAAAALPGAGQPVPMNGVPFAFARNATGDDHVDVGASWARFGSLAGYFPANSGTFGGRWVAADKLDPARLAMYIPTRRYKALHLIAVADGGKDEVPVVSAQFYRPDAGHPLNFTGRVPDMAGAPKILGTSQVRGKPISFRSTDGKAMQLYHVVVPLDPDAFSWFTDLNRIGLEITKQAQYYRGYPDPLEYSWHGGGLPSSVHIYAMTLERADVDVTIDPENFGHVWTAPSAPGYTVELRNGLGSATTAQLSIATGSADGRDRTHQQRQVALPANGKPVKVRIALKPTRYGLHNLSFTLVAGAEKATYRRTLAYLHPNTREQKTWEDGRGAIFGFWPLGGGHDTPPAERELPVMAAAGAETSTRNYQDATPALRAMAEKYHFLSEAAFDAGSIYYSGYTPGYPGNLTFDAANPEATGKAFVEALRKIKSAPSAISRPTFLAFFAEPNVGNIATGIWPGHYGEDYKLTANEQEIFNDLLAKFLVSARAARKEWPDIKLLLPYGDPMNTALFLRYAPETRELIDGVAIDVPEFERTPEQQINQVTLNRLYPIFKELRQYIKDPYFVLTEGNAVSSKDIDTGQRGQADTLIRNFLVMIGYGITRFEAGISPWDCANYWGENHYGGGWNTRQPLAMPKPAYIQYATMTRHLNRANFTKYVPTGSTSVYCQQYKHYKDGHLVHALWTVRGKRPVTVKASPGSKLTVYDANDNGTPLPPKNGTVTFSIDQSPVYLEGLTADAAITLGASDHSDSRPGRHSVKLTNFGDGTWQIVEKHDVEYEKNKPLQIERFLAKMSGRSVTVPTQHGTKALAVRLGKQAKERGVMPYYTTLQPKAPIAIPGKASHLGMWGKAASDWGRVVYDLRDAKGEKWISVGTTQDWNNDDIHTWSAFNFDGWRYIQFQMPSNLPYDNFRERGSTWWGSYGGDGIIDLPLKLHKVMVERRNQVIYGNDLVPARPDDVLLAELRAEYASAIDKTPEAVRLSKLRMPLPKSAPALANPIEQLAKTGVGAPTKVLRVTDPTYQYDGTRAHLHFTTVPGARGYDVWVSPYADGRGAMQLGSGWTESGKMIEGLRPGIEFYAFVVYIDAEGKRSKPSAPLKFVLTSRFGYK